MNYFDHFFRKLLGSGQPEARSESSFTHLSEDQIEAHERRSLYGTFQLTEAIRPSYDLQIVPTAGYRHSTSHDLNTGVNVPVITAATSREKLMDLFYELLDPLGDEVNVFLKTSHGHAHGDHDDRCREHIDLAVLKSTFYDFEDVLLDDGYVGVVVFNRHIPLGVQFDEHKLLITFGHNLEPVEEILHRHRLRCREDMKFICDAEHWHLSTDELHERFQRLTCAVGADHPQQEDEDPPGDAF